MPERSESAVFVKNHPDQGGMRVLVGMWDATKKAIESQSPEAHGKRLLHIADEKIIPKLNPTQRIWVEQHAQTIRDAAMIAGVGITTAEITAAVIFGAKVVNWGKYKLELARARRLVSWVPLGDGLPDIPVTSATSRTFALKSETQRKIYSNYFQEAEETTRVLKDVRRKWKELRPTFGKNHWVREQINGTIATLFDMTEDQIFRMKVAHALASSTGSALNRDFQALFYEAHKAASQRFGWYTTENDARRMWAFWNSWFEQSGLEILRERSARFVRPEMHLRDSVIAYMQTMLFDPIVRHPSAKIITPKSLYTIPYTTRLRVRQVIKRLRSRYFLGVGKDTILHLAQELIPGKKWNKPEIAALIQQERANVLSLWARDNQILALILDTLWIRRNKPEIQTVVRQYQQLTLQHHDTEARTHMLRLFDDVVMNNKEIKKLLKLNQRSYYQRRKYLQKLYRAWTTDHHHAGLWYLQKK